MWGAHQWRMVVSGFPPSLSVSPFWGIHVHAPSPGNSPYIELKAPLHPPPLNFSTCVSSFCPPEHSASAVCCLFHMTALQTIEEGYRVHFPTTPCFPHHPLPQSVISEKLGEVFLFTDALGNFMVFRLMLSLSRCANICLIWYKLIVQKRKKPL